MSARALAVSRDTRILRTGAGILDQVPQTFREIFAERPAMVVADNHTFAAAGQQVEDAFKVSARPVAEPFIFNDPSLYAEHRFVKALEGRLRGGDAIPVAVGSGTINDLTKLAAHRTGRRYFCVATAASMDGYTAYGASITHQGSKQTFECPAPVGVLADLDVIGAAPAEMNAWGYADLLAKTTAGADWILADALAVEPIHREAWDLVQGGLREAVSNPAGVRTGDRNVIGRLVEGLMLGGFAMQAAQSSRPASGAEHQFSHLWDMQHHTHAGSAPSHGLKVGIGTLAVTALYECLLRTAVDRLDVDACVAQWPDESAWVRRAGELFGAGQLGSVARQEISAKYVSPDALREQLDALRTLWPLLVPGLRAQLLPFAEVKAMLHAAGAAAEPEQIGITRQRLRESFWRAFFIRRRFTVLDVAVRTGQLERCLESLFGPGGVWSIPASEGATVP